MGIMPSIRKKGKKIVGFFATEEEKAMLKQAASLAGFESLADYLRWVAKEMPTPGIRKDEE